MPLNSAQLAGLVERAAQRRQATPAPAAQPTSKPQKLTPRPRDAVAVPAPVSLPQLAEAADFPIGWQLRKESWHFHRRFYRVFRRPMEPGEYSYLLHQIPGRAEHLGEDCWRVTLPHGKRTLAIRATRWRLITILPKDWQPPLAAEVRQTAQGLSAEPGG